MPNPIPAPPCWSARTRSGRPRILPALIWTALLLDPAVAESQTDSSAMVGAFTRSNPRAWTELVRLQGIVEAEGRLQWLRNLGEQTLAASDLYLRRFQVAGTGTATDWLSAQFLLNVEYLGLAERGHTPSILLDEGHLDLVPTGTSPYLIVGMRGQPFGQFESHLVSDPLTQQAYELKAVGLTAGHTGPRGLDVSVTLYKGTAHLDGLIDAGFIDTTRVHRKPMSVRHVESFVAECEVAPVEEHVTFFGAFVSEPGSNRRNLTVDAGGTFAVSRPGLVCDVERIQALQRETYVDATRAFEDAALSVTVGFVFSYRHAVLHHRRTFAGRQEAIRSHPMVAALRYDSFDDGGLARAYGSWSVRDRWSLGGRYTWLVLGGASLYGMVELGSTRYRAPDLTSTLERERDILLRLGLVF